LGYTAFAPITPTATTKTTTNKEENPPFKWTIYFHCWKYEGCISGTLSDSLRDERHSRIVLSCTWFNKE
jgi:hypothetical protein